MVKYSEFIHEVEWLINKNNMIVNTKKLNAIIVESIWNILNQV